MEPYNSAEIGLFRASKVDLGEKFTCSPEDIHSKCVILSDATLRGPNSPPDTKQLDPVPTAVLKELNSETATFQSLLGEYSNSFKKGVPTWTFFSLLLPGRDT